jgi:predicted porin
MSICKAIRLPVAGAAAAALWSVSASAAEFDFYGSLRIQGEAVNPDVEAIDDYTGLRDAYSRIGFKASQQLTDGVTGYAQFELPFDSANLAVQDPWNQDEDIRIAKIGVKGGLGDISVGQMWMPYYNAIAYPVDMFSSYYSGFATYTTFRQGDTVSYYSPSFGGFSGAVAYSHENGAAETDGDLDDRLQATVSYSLDSLTVSGGVDDLGGADDSRIWGASLMWQATDDLFIGAKYEQHDSDIDNGYGADGDAAMNLYAGYTLGKNTFKAMVADVDNYGEQVIHLGIDHQYTKSLKFFAEYYSEQDSAAITTKRGGAAETCWTCDGGWVGTVGMRYDFGASTESERQSSLAMNSSPIDFAFYASVRVAAESVDPDGSALNSYSGLRDAYSRIGATADYAIDNDTSIYAKLELPFDIPNKAVQDPWDQDEDIRIGKVGVKGAFGDLAVGQMWLPYYNAIAYPVDMFSSYYSGFATFTSFRKGDTIAYYTPSWSGLSGAVAYSEENGAAESDGDLDDRLQATVSYSLDKLTLAGGVDDLGGADDSRIWGASAMWQATDDLYIGAKYEQQDSDIDTGYGADGDAAMNLYAGYTLGKNTFKAMLADVDNYGEQVIHLGIDHQYSKSLKFFAEYYSEEETAAITTKRGGAAETCWACDGGSVVTAGLRWDFGAP